MTPRTNAAVALSTPQPDTRTRLRVLPDEQAELPTSRAECIGGHRPCPLVRCQYHLYLDVNPETGHLKINFPDLEPWDLEDSCALDVADRGGITLEEVGAVMNLTRERVRQVEAKELRHLRRSGILDAWRPDGDSDA